VERGRHRQPVDGRRSVFDERSHSRLLEPHAGLIRHRLVADGACGCRGLWRALAGSGGLPAVLFDASQTGVSGARSQPGSTGSTALTLSSSAPAPSITPLVFHPGSDNGAVFASGVWTGNESGVQFNLAAQQEHEPTGQPLPIGKPGQPVLIVSGSQPGSQGPFNGTTTSTTTSVGGSLVPPSGAGSYSVFAAVGGVFGVIGGASQAALGIGVVAASGAATAASEGGLSPLTVPIIIGGSVVVAHGLDQVWAGATTIWTGQPQRPYAAQALDPLTGNETTSDLANAGVGIVFSLGSGAYANGAQIAGQVAGSGDEIATVAGTVAGRTDDAVGLIDDVDLVAPPMGVPTIGRPVSFPQNAAQLRHIFRDAPGHMPDTIANRSVLQTLANDRAAILGVDQFGNTWAARVAADGTQVWVQIRNGVIINGGVNPVFRPFNPLTGLSGG
jgi:hypothetical protein